MPAPYSVDFRWRIVYLAQFQHFSPGDVAKLLNVCSRTVTRYLKLFNLTGDIIPRHRRNGPHRLLGKFEQLTLLRLIIDNPGIYLAEIQDHLFTKFAITCSAATICRTLKSMGCSRQKIQRIALQRSDQCRAKFMAEVAIYDPTMFVWIDETGCDKRNSMRRYGYSVRGIPPCDHRLLIRGTRYSAIPVMSMYGIHDVEIVEGSVDGTRFETFFENTVLPILNPFNGTNPRSIVIMDNCSIHHIDPIIDLIETNAQAKVLFLPPYSPDLMPLEEVFSKVKSVLKMNDKIFQACSAPRAFLSMAFTFISTEDCIGYTRHSGYIQ